MTSAVPDTQQQQQQGLPGEYFDVPGITGGATQWTEQDDNTVNQAFTIQSGTQNPITGILPMRQTDVVTDWFAALNITQTYTAGTSTLTASAWAPFVAIGPVRLLIQNQYASIDVESGIDLYIFDTIRPHSKSEILSGVNQGFSPSGDPVGGSATGYPTTAVAQVNNLQATWSTGTTSYNYVFRLPAAQWFDLYYDLAETGEPVTEPHPALVSPQYMAGTTRVIAPSISMNPGNGATTDLGPVNIGAGTGTFTGSGTLRIRRKAIYAGNQQTQPPIYAWQYRRKTSRFNVAGVSQYSFPVPLDTGQLAWKTGARTVIAQTDDSRHIGRLVLIADAFYKQAKASRPQLLYVDETLDFFHGNSAPITGNDILIRSQRAGRERGMSCLFGSQRMYGLPMILKSELERLYVFRLDARRDAKHLEEIGAPVFDPPEEPHVFYYWWKGAYRKVWGPYRLTAPRRA